MPPKLNGGSPKIALERLVRKLTVSNGQCGHPLRSRPNKTLACRQSRPPLRRTWAGTYGLGGRLFLHTSGIARVGSYDLSISWLCFWLVVAQSVPGFVTFHSRISFHHLSVFHPLELRQNDRQSPGRTDTPSTRIPHPATLRCVKVSGPHWATCHTFRESTWLPPTRGVEPHETCLISPTELTSYGNDRGSLKKALRHTETGLMKVQCRKTFGGMVATFGFP